jgi:uncharacterized membrane protein
MAKQSRTQQVVQNQQGKGHLIQEVFDDNLLPDASEIEKLQRLDPNIIEWLKTRAECEQNFRQEAYKEKIDLVRRSEKGERNISLIGLVFSFFLAILGMAFSAFLIYYNHEVLGTIFAGATILALVGIFMAKVKSPNKEQTQK